MTRATDALRTRQRAVANADASARQLVEAYAKAWETVRSDLADAAADAAARAQATGDELNPAVYRSARLQASLDALDRQLRTAARLSGVTVTGRAPAAVTAGAAAARELGKMAGADFNMPPERALARIVARATERITRDFARLPDEVADRIRTSLLRGVAGGLGPDRVAALIVGNARDAAGMGLTRSLAIARTELLDASRYASLAMYRSNGVDRWRWLASLSTRSCPACWALHNSVHSDEFMAAHPGCRCTPVPELDGAADLGSPREAFAQLTRADQLAVMGPRRLAYLNGGGSWDALTQRVDNPGWRPSYVVRPVARLAA